MVSSRKNPIELDRFYFLSASFSREHFLAWFVQSGPQLRHCTSFLLRAQRFETGDNVEQFLVDATLAKTMECPIVFLQQFIDVFVGAFHRRQADHVLAPEGFGAHPEELHEKIFADERPQGRGTATHDLGQVSRRIGKFGQPASPAFVQRQQLMTDGCLSA